MVDQIARNNKAGVISAIRFDDAQILGDLSGEVFIVVGSSDQSTIDKIISLSPVGVVGKLSPSQKEKVETFGIEVFDEAHLEEKDGVFEVRRKNKQFNPEKFKEWLSDYKNR